MKSLLMASVATVALTAGTAFAADMGMPLKAPTQPPPTVSWTGCYVDGGVGYGMWKQDSYSESTVGLVPLSNTTSFGGDGWLGRLGGGCDYQISSSFVVGAFADYDFMSVKGQYMDPLSGFIGQENESRSWAAGGRIGYLVTPSLLTYFDGGYTQTHFDQINFGTLTPPAVPTGVDIPAQTYNGWFLGGGYELCPVRHCANPRPVLAHRISLRGISSGRCSDDNHSNGGAIWPVGSRAEGRADCHIRSGLALKLALI
jgi:outer membrane immunogenic protein